MKENINNIIGVCKECGDDRKASWQKSNKGLKINVGDFVKIAITDKKGTEHLWFQIIAVNKVCPTCKSDDVYESSNNPEYTHRCNNCGDYFSEFIGRCDNDAILVKVIKLNDLDKFTFKDIEEYLKGGSK